MIGSSEKVAGGGSLNQDGNANGNRDFFLAFVEEHARLSGAERIRLVRLPDDWSKGSSPRASGSLKSKPTRFFTWTGVKPRRLFFGPDRIRFPEGRAMNPTPQTPSNLARLVAEAAREFHEKQCGHLPGAVTVVLSEGVLVITLHDALSPAEKALAASTEGAQKVQEFHKRLFEQSCDVLRKDIERITGVVVRDAATEMLPASGTVVYTFAGGTIVQVFLLADPVPPEAGEHGGTGLAPAAPVTSVD